MKLGFNGGWCERILSPLAEDSRKLNSNVQNYRYALECEVLRLIG